MMPTFDPQARAPLPKLSGPVSFPDGAQIGEQGASAGPPLNDFPGQRAQFGAAHRGRLFARVAERTINRIKILGLKAGNVRLGATKIPAQVVEIPPF